MKNFFLNYIFLQSIVRLYAGENFDTFNEIEQALSFIPYSTSNQTGIALLTDQATVQWRIGSHLCIWFYDSNFSLQTKPSSL
ncbi:MAG: hypothetical protein H0V82_01865 [Candidatus Protochlamydia sp.]|nr:hypothetical protein [Candidatus Protochlamydia sp.]